MATLHLMIGLPGSGKTTEAIRLAEKYHALRLTPDEWHYYLFGNDFHNDVVKDTEHNKRHTKIEELMWNTAKKVLQLDTDVILDFGCWTKKERDEFRINSHSIGANFKIHYMDHSKEVIWERLKKRNKMLGNGEFFYITKESLDEWSKLFEAPTEDELL